MNIKKISLLVLVIAAMAGFVAFDLGRYLSLDYLKQSQAEFLDLYARQPFTVAAVYFAL